MKYTRYDLKKKNDTKTFAFVIFLILVFAFILGTFISKVLIRNPGSAGTASNNSKTVVENKSASKDNLLVNNKDTKFIAIQGGIYRDKNNIAESKSVLAQQGTPFGIVEGDKTRVFLGIYPEEQGEKIIKILTDQKIDNSKMVFNISRNNMCDVEIAEIINANLQILNKLSEKNVKSIQTDELKKWCAALKKVDKDSKNQTILNELKDHVNKLPKEISKDKSEENYIYIFNILKKASSN